jgi:hypothetical protein
MWTLHKQQQHCGAQLHARSGKARQAGEAPGEATRDRAAQDHDRAGDQALQAGDYPASPLEHGGRDNTPAAPEGQVEWDEVVQPRRQDQQLTELEQDERDAGEGPDG